VPPTATRDRLLDAAERLFAEEGIQAVSLRQINVAAGARNTAAANYHFRTKNDLIRAVAARRMDALSEERLRRLAAVEAEARGGAPDLRRIVEAGFLPPVELLGLPGGGGACYVRFLARVPLESSIPLMHLATRAWYESSARLLELLGRALPALEPSVLMHRALFAIDVLISAAANLARVAMLRGQGLDSVTITTFGSWLVDFIVGGLAAPDTTIASAPRPTGGAESGAFWGLAALGPGDVSSG
jgi:AcrR family transcriptional regulator